MYQRFILSKFGDNAFNKILTLWISILLYIFYEMPPVVKNLLQILTAASKELVTPKSDPKKICVSSHLLKKLGSGGLKYIFFYFIFHNWIDVGWHSECISTL